MLKKLIFVILILLMVHPGFALAKSAAAENGIVGEWYLECLQTETYDFKPVLLFEGDLHLTSLQALALSKDGSGTVSNVVSDSVCTWTANGSEYEIVIEGQAYKARLENEKLYIDGMKDASCPIRNMRYTFVFSRSFRYAVVPPVCPANSQEELFGEYTGAYLLQGGKIRKLTESIGIRLSENRIDIGFETERLTHGTSFNGEAVTLDLRDAQHSHAVWLLAGYTNLRIRPCEKRGGIIAADAFSDENEFGFRIYFVSEMPVRNESVASKAAEAFDSALDALFEADALSDENELGFRSSFVSDMPAGNERVASRAAGTSDSALDALFEADALRLEKHDLPMPAKEDVPCEIPDGSFERIGLSTQDVRKSLAGTIDFSKMLIASVAPGGKTGLAVLDNTFFAYCDGKYRLLYPSPDRGAEDLYGNLSRFLSGKRGHIPYEGVIYSPDGNYAVMPNIRVALMQARYNVDPILIDLRTGETRLIETYANKVLEDQFGTMISACFSSDSRTLFYTVYRSRGAALYRYSIEEERTELFLSTPEKTNNTRLGTTWFFQGMALTPEGNFALISDNMIAIPKQLVLLSTQDEIAFTVEPHSIPNIGNRMLSLEVYSYGRDSDNALLLLRNMYARASASTAESLPESSDGLFLPPDVLVAAKPDAGLDGLADMWAIQADPIRAIKLNTEDLQGSAGKNESGLDLNSCFMIHEAEQSPDGQYALLLVSHNAAYSLLMLRLSDMALRTVEGIDASEILFDNQANEYPAVIDWNADTLTILTHSGLQLYRFD